MPTRCGIGLRAPHYREMISKRPRIGWVEVHSENYFGAGGQPHVWLERIREHYPVGLHGVGLSLGSADSLDDRHLARLRRLVDRYDPMFVSEHLCWSSIGRRHLHELLPLPYTDAVLRHVSARIHHVQEALGRRILVENITAYVRFRNSEMLESQFLTALVESSGCGLLLDVNNVYVNAVNHGDDPRAFIDALPAQAIGEIHLAGFEETPDGLVDTHGRPVSAAVWTLYDHALSRLGPVPSLIEWDTDIPALDVLIGEARRADAILENLHARVA